GEGGVAPDGARPRGVAGASVPFERIWRAYPKRVGRAAAKKAFDAAMARGVVSVEELERAVKQYALSVAHLGDQKYIKQLANWLRDECWLEDPQPPRRKEPKPDCAAKAAPNRAPCAS